MNAIPNTLAEYERTWLMCPPDMNNVVTTKSMYGPTLAM
jgi:hypothetical protein